MLDDVLLLAPGDQVVVDGEVLRANALEVDESLLTGESEPCPKRPDDELLSGSFVTAGSGYFQATAVGADAYAHRLAEEAKRFSLVESELRDGVNRILQAVQWLLIPMAVLLVSSQLANQESAVEAVQGSVAGLAAMIPEGLVLLTSLAFAIGVIRLGQQEVLTQELAAIEGLARVDVICLDKTGTITENRLDVSGVEPLGGLSATALGALAGSDPNPNASLAAIGESFPPPPGWESTSIIPFSSARKWSAADFGANGAWYLGAPDILLEPRRTPIPSGRGSRPTPTPVNGSSSWPAPRPGSRPRRGCPNSSALRRWSCCGSGSARKPPTPSPTSSRRVWT